MSVIVPFALPALERDNGSDASRRGADCRIGISGDEAYVVLSERVGVVGHVLLWLVHKAGRASGPGRSGRFMSVRGSRRLP